MKLISRKTPRIAIVFVLVMALLSYAATPPSGTVSEGNPVVTWDGPPVAVATASATCNGSNDSACDNFRLNIVPPASGSFQVKITIQPFGGGDWDLQVYAPDGTTVVGSSGNAPSAAELVTLNNPAAGTYTVAAAPFAPSPGVPGSYSGRAEFIPLVTPPPPPPPGSEPISYFNHVAPAPLGRPSSDEPSIGCNYKTDRVMFTGVLQTLQVTYDNCTSPARDTWRDVSFLTTSLITLDPILFTDQQTGRTIVSQLSANCSTMAFTDNDGGVNGQAPGDWTPSQGCGINSGVDHQTVGGGRFHDPLTRNPNGPLYPNAVYYCAQDIVVALCARSDTGGLTFGPGVPIYDLTECGGLHGQVKVSPADGTVYVPNRNCGGDQAVVVSEDNGITWDPRPIPGAVPGNLDPTVALATDGTVYFSWNNGGVEPMVAVSQNKGMGWFNYRNVGAPFGIQSSIFTTVAAGDPDRALVAFHGSTTFGGGGDDPDWPGDFFLFVAHTYNTGNTWTTINATPNDPVQRGTICPNGIGCNNGTRNLLDFMGATIDREGRGLVGYADGCVGDCPKDRTKNGFTAVSTIARQVNGRRMFRQFDVTGVPASPLLTATFNRCPGQTATILAWSTPDDRGSPITAYNIYRRTSTSNFVLLTTVGGNINSYTDNDVSQTYFYRVTAVNARGESTPCGEVSASCPGGGQPEDACKFPGLTILTDPTGDFTLPGEENVPGSSGWDMQKLSITEDFGLLGPGKIMFVLKVVSLQTVPRNTTWPIQFRTPDGDATRAARMHTNALGQVFFTVASGANSTNPNLNAGTPADPLSGFDADGTIRIVVSRSAIGNPAPSQMLDQFLIRVRFEAGAVSITPDNMPDSLARTGSYTIKGSENCQPVNRPPDAVDDSATTTMNDPVVVNVVANDTDPDGDPLTVTAVTQPANGTATNNGDGTVTYRPNSGFTGNDSFTYTISDGNGGTDTATVRVTVNPRPNRPPDAVNDTARTCKNRPVRINVLANDTDPDGDRLTVTGVTQPANGTAVRNSDSTVTYTPRRNFVGTDTFTYTISDGRGGSDTAAVTVTVVRDCDDIGDDDDFDDDGDRDDGDADDDNDGSNDNADPDDDNDGSNDNADDDDDNDGIHDADDSESHRETQSRQTTTYAPAQSTNYPVPADASTLLIIAVVEAPQAQAITVEIYNPAGQLVARSVPAPGRVVASAPVVSPGTYTVRVRNTSSGAIASTTKLITRSPWF